MSIQPLLVTSLALVCALPSQGILNVGPGGHAQIRDALALAAPGDTVLVSPGNYMDFTCKTGVTIRALVPGTVTVSFDFAGLPPVCGCSCLTGAGPTRFVIPVGETAHVVGLEFVGNSALIPCGPSFIYHRVHVTSGRVTFDDCVFNGGFYGLKIASAIVHLQDCTVRSIYFGPGLVANQADVTIVGGSVTGVDAPNGVYAPGSGISLTNSTLHASHTSIAGGAMLAATIGSHGIEATGGSLWLSDSTVTGHGDCAVDATGLVRIDRCTFTGSGAGCASSPTGAPLVGVERGSAIEIGTLFEVHLTSEPGALQLLYGSTSLLVPTMVPILEQPLLINPNELFLADLAIAGASGQVTFSYPIPAIAALRNSEFWLQGMGGTSFPLQASPVIGGIVR